LPAATGMKKTKRTTMTFWDHVEELRRRVLVAAVFIVAGTVAGYILFPPVIRIMQASLGEQLYAFQIAEGFFVRLKTAVSIGLFLSLPFLVFELVLFIIPALNGKEKRILFAFLLSSYALFLGGMAFAFKGILPVTMQFLKSSEFFPQNVGRMLSLTEYLDFYLVFLLGFGICFQFPIVMLLVMKLRIVPFSFFTKNFKYFLIAIFIVAAVVTPSPDVVSQIMMAIPMLALYLLTLLVAKLTGLGKTKEKSTADGRR
jgi:sec-independent protein translocase protein TatC